MLRNHYKSEQFLRNFLPFLQQQRLIQQQKTVLCSKNVNVSRQGKIMGKLFGQRLSGSKKRWFPSTTDAATAASSNILFKQSKFGKTSGGDKNSVRRMAVLNKLFMKHVTDLMATGEISESILGKGLQISRVKISQDFAYVNVFWLTSGEVGKDAVLEQELQRCSGLLRHELSQLGLMGVVPRIKFVKDKLFTNLYQVENLLRDMDLGPYEEEEPKEENNWHCRHNAEVLQKEFYGSKTKDITGSQQQELNGNNESIVILDVNIPEMRHDVLGLDHKGIMLKILTKMRKSKQAWDQHLQNTPTEINDDFNSAIPSTCFSQLVKTNEKLSKVEANSEKFEAFLAKRKEKRNTPERKRFRSSRQHIEDDDNVDEDDYAEHVLSARQRQVFLAADYLHDDEDDKKHK